MTAGHLHEDVAADREEPCGPRGDRTRPARLAAPELRVPHKIARREVRADAPTPIVVELDLHHAVGDEEGVARRIATPIERLAAREHPMLAGVEQHVDGLGVERASERRRAQEIAHDLSAQRARLRVDDRSAAAALDGPQVDGHGDARQAGRLDARRLHRPRAADAHRRLLPEDLPAARLADDPRGLFAAGRGRDRDRPLLDDEERVGRLPRAVDALARPQAHHLTRRLDVRARPRVETAEDDRAPGHLGERRRHGSLAWASARSTTSSFCTIAAVTCGPEGRRR